MSINYSASIRRPSNDDDDGIIVSLCLQLVSSSAEDQITNSLESAVHTAGSPSEVGECGLFATMKQLQLLFVCLHLILIVSCRTYLQPWVELPSSYYHHDPLPRRETPLDFMVHVVNRLGLRLLEEHNKDNTLHNLALSPYGATSVIVAIAEGISGSAKDEIFNGANLPCDISVLRIGLRDMHRHLKSYFIPREGFLAGLTLNSDNVSMTKEYENVLRFYGYDVASFNSALTPPINATSNSSSSSTPASTTTTPTTPSATMATSETQDSSSTDPTITSTESLTTEEVTETPDTTTTPPVTDPEDMESRTTTGEPIIDNTPAEIPEQAATEAPLPTVVTTTTEETKTPTESISTEQPTTMESEETNPTDHVTSPENEENNTPNQEESTPSTENTSIQETNNPTGQGNNPNDQENVSNDHEENDTTKPTLEENPSDEEDVPASSEPATIGLEENRPEADEVTIPNDQEGTAQVENSPASEAIYQDTVVPTGQGITTVNEDVPTFPDQNSNPSIEEESTQSFQNTSPSGQGNNPISEEITNSNPNEENASQVTANLEETPVDQETITPAQETTSSVQESTQTTQGDDSNDQGTTSTGQGASYATAQENYTPTIQENTPTPEVNNAPENQDESVTTGQANIPTGEASGIPTNEDVAVPTGTGQGDSHSPEDVTVSTEEETTTTVASNDPTSPTEQEKLPASPEQYPSGEQSSVTSEGITVPTGQGVDQGVDQGTDNAGQDGTSSPTSEAVTAPASQGEQTIPVLVQDPNTSTSQETTNPTGPQENDQSNTNEEQSDSNPGNDTSGSDDYNTTGGDDGGNISDDEDEIEARIVAIDGELKKPIANSTELEDDSMNKLDKNDDVESEYSFTETPLPLPLTLASIMAKNTNPINESPMLGFQNTNRVIRNGKRSFSRKKRHVPHVREEVYYGRYYDEFHLPTLNSYGFEPLRPRPLTFLVNGKIEDTNVNFMNYDTVLPYYFSPELNALALRLPLDIPKYYLLLVLPVNEQGVDKLICHMSAQCDLKYLVKKLKNTYVKATIPNFTLKGVVSLKQSFQNLGLKKIFESRQANFSAMTTDENVYVTNIEQAVTVTIKNYLIQPPDSYSYSYNPIVFQATHPFLYFVMDSHLDVALMAGKITNPSNNRIR